MIEVRGKGCVVARIIAHSASSTSSQELLTYELEYPRFIHSELMTHRLFSRNAASSRAIPVKASSSDIDETIKLHEKQVWVGWDSNAPRWRYKCGCDQIDNRLHVLKDMLILIDMAGPDGEVHLSDYDCRSLDKALDLENTETKLKALI